MRRVYKRNSVNTITRGKPSLSQTTSQTNTAQIPSAIAEDGEKQKEAQETTLRESKRSRPLTLYHLQSVEEACREMCISKTILSSAFGFP